MNTNKIKKKKKIARLRGNDIKIVTSVYRETMALPIPQRLAKINIEIQNVENALRNTQRMLNGFLRHIRSVNLTAIEVRMEASCQIIRD